MKRNWKRSTLLTSGALLLGLGLGSTLAPSPGNWLVASAQAQDDQLIRSLFGPETTPEEFAAAVQQAKAANVSEQVLLEAQIARTFYSHDTAALLALRDPLQKAGAALDLKVSQMFETRSDYDSLVQGVLALEANDKGDATAFEKHIKDALWLGPMPLRTIYLRWLDDYRLAEAMKKVVVPLDTKLNTSEGKETSLKEVLGTNKALLVDFWATWCAPCMVGMGELKEKGAKLAPQGVVVVGLNTESDAVKAATVKQQESIALPWLVEPAGVPYSVLLRADTLPRAALISAEGKVLFNGHPADPALKAALAKIGATL